MACTSPLFSAGHAFLLFSGDLSQIVLVSRLRADLVFDRLHSRCWRQLLFGWFGVALLLQSMSLAQATEYGDIVVGARYGSGAVYGNHKEFKAGELFLRLEPMKWRKFFMNFDAALECGGAKIRNDRQEVRAILIGPVFIRRFSQQWSFESGVRLTWLAEHHVGGRDLGGPFQFTSHVGLAWQFSKQVAAAIRFQHTSNARMYDVNPGVDLQVLELRYRF